MEVKFYNMEVEVNGQLQAKHDGLYIISDGSGIHVARNIAQV